MTARTQGSEHGGHGPLSAAISTAIVQLVREYTGRGPTRAHTTLRDSVVLVMLEDTLTHGERALVAHGRGDLVITMRTEFQNAMRQPAAETISRLTGCTVIAMMSANHISPDLGAEVFVLDAPPILPTAARAAAPQAVWGTRSSSNQTQWPSECPAPQRLAARSTINRP